MAMRLQSFPILIKDRIQDRGFIYQFQQENRWLSNFWPCNVILPGENGLPDMEFDNVEKAYVAWKTLDAATRSKIQNMTPGEAKKLSHTPEFALRSPYTDEMRVNAMEILVAQKFSERNPDLLDKLLETKNDIIAEGNVHGDAFFGIDLVKGYGLNHLGRIIMNIRAKNQMH
jgi:predicted NAD-dependent protein-ADP-ribosyltransferase YbiA (DUF1768 family)